MKTLSVVAALIWLVSCRTSAASVSFSDDTFNGSDWQVSMLFQGGNGGSVTGTQVASGGNPEAYRRVVDSINGPLGGTPSAILGFHERLGAIYDPTVQGPIGTVDFAIDFLNISSFGQGQGYEVALSQNGKLYVPFDHLTDTLSGWQHDSSVGLTVNDFFQVIAPPVNIDLNQHPDFSATGSPISFGFFTFNATTDVPFTIIVGYDNWNVTLHTVPEPGTLGMMALAIGVCFAGLARGRTREIARSTCRTEKRWRKMRFAAAALALSVASNASATSVTFSDGTFNDSDWQVSMLFQSGNGGSVTGTQVASGGNPGAYRKVVDSVNSASPSYTQVLGFHERQGATYSPSIQGPISTIDFSIDFLNVSAFGAGQAFEVALSQNGNLYVPSRHETDTFSGWQHDSSTGLAANDLFLVLSAGLDLNQHPDFSATASPIAFGFYTANSTTDVPFMITVGYDNWNVTLHTVPEPGTMALLGGGLILLAAWRSRV